MATRASPAANAATADPRARMSASEAFGGGYTATHTSQGPSDIGDPPPNNPAQQRRGQRAVEPRKAVMPRHLLPRPVGRSHADASPRIPYVLHRRVRFPALDFLA